MASNTSPAPLSDITNASNVATTGSPTMPELEWIEGLHLWMTPPCQNVDLGWGSPQPVDRENRRVREGLEQWLGFDDTPTRPYSSWGGDANDIFGPIRPRSGLDLLAQVAPDPDPIRAPTSTPIPALTIPEARRARYQAPGEPLLRWRPDYSSDDFIDPMLTINDILQWPEQAPAYRQRPRTTERTVIPPTWDPYPDSRTYRAPRASGPSRTTRGALRHRPTTMMTARRTRNEATRLAHRRRALSFLTLIPLPQSFAEFDRLSMSQQRQVAYLFSMQEELNPSNQAHPTVLHWRRTIIQEYEGDLAGEWEHPCIECSLPFGPWCS